MNLQLVVDDLFASLPLAGHQVRKYVCQSNQHKNKIIEGS